MMYLLSYKATERSIANWERKEADTLADTWADAIGKHRRRNPYLYVTSEPS